MYSGDPEHLRVSVLALGPSAGLQVEAAWPSQCWAQGQQTQATPQVVHKPPSQPCGGDAALTICLEKY